MVGDCCQVLVRRKRGASLLNKYRVFGDMSSGNCYKVAMLLEFMEAPYQWEAVDVLSGFTQSFEFKQLNPNGKIPLLD